MMMLMLAVTLLPFCEVMLVTKDVVHILHQTLPHCYHSLSLLLEAVSMAVAGFLE